MSAGFGYVEVAAALDRCRGDEENSLQLLVSGWVPEHLPMTATASHAVARCPFTGAVAGAGQTCPVAAAVPSPARSTSSSLARGMPNKRARVLGSSLQKELDELLCEAPSDHKKWIIALTDGADTSSQRH